MDTKSRAWIRICNLGLLVLVLGTVGCASSHPELQSVERVEIERFMGDWRVVGLIPNRVEKDAYDSVESYRLREDGKIDITYTFRDGGFDRELERLKMVARIKDEESNAEWRVRPYWPLSLKYVVTDLADDYRYTVVAHPSRNYVWIMAREPKLSTSDWEDVLGRLEAQGFDPARIVRVQHQPAPDVTSR